MSRAKAPPRYVVGIDLGTTNTVVAFQGRRVDQGLPASPSEAVPRANPDGASPSARVEVFAVVQHVSPTEVQPRGLLPSALYAPLPSEGPNQSPTSSPDQTDAWVVGAWAKARSTEVPERSVTSAKSWLAHAGVDRMAQILPWRGASEDEEGPRISPVDAQAAVLRHVRTAWDSAHPEALLAEQEVVLTVPASFDEAARSLTIEAVRRAGFHPDSQALPVRLLEEPQAAFLDWARRVGDVGLREVAEVDGGVVLVVDVGGGTTDFSLVRVDRGLTPTRIAVGEHLLLGGDNIDLALAHLLEPRLLRGGEERLGAMRFGQLVLTCRQAKEQLLHASLASTTPGATSATPIEVTVTLLGEGSRLLGGARSTSLGLDEVLRVLDAFFPSVTAEEVQRPRPMGLGLRAFGLPYERDPAVTRHLGRFLARHAPELLVSAGEKRPAPRLSVLLNGGVFHARAIVERVEAALAALTGCAPRLLPLGDPDLSVARGAVAYGLARHGLGHTIRGGSARSYYVGLEARGKTSAVCVLPRGSEPGQRQVLELPLVLMVGQSARFEVFASASEPGTVGEVIGDVTAGVTSDGPTDAMGLTTGPAGITRGASFERLPPLFTVIPAHDQAPAGPREHDPRGVHKGAAATGPGGGQERLRSGQVPVRLEAEITELGTLELACVERTERAARHVLRFDLRATTSRGSGQASKAAAPASSLSSASPAPATSASTRPPAAVAHGRTQEAVERIQRVFGKAASDVDPREAKNLLRELERLLGERGSWPPSLLRTLFDVCGPLATNRRRSPDHERTFWSLAGFCLRPGFGDPRDAQRLALLEPLLEPGLFFAKEPNGWRAFWIAWRRLAYGLSESTQVSLRDKLDPFLEPSDGRLLKKPKNIRPEPPDEVLHLVSSLERVPATRRAALGGWILERTWTSTDLRLYAALGRLGARVPLGASAHHVVSIRTAESWIGHLLRAEWRLPLGGPTKGQASSTHAIPFACVQMARLTGDRGRDVSDGLRAEVGRRIEREVLDEGLRTAWLGMLNHVVAADEVEHRSVLGDDLPLGLRLA